MRKITRNITNAFNCNGNCTIGHDKVVTDKTTKMFYRNNLIAEKIKNKLYIDTCGWMTNTTKERLNGLQGVQIKQIKGVWYLNGTEWNGKRILVS